jgi:hypothetical protein
MDSASVQSFVDKIRDLSASRFIDSRSGAFLMDITVTSKEGRHIEKVLLSKTNNNYVAKRENESTLYELDAKAIEELQKSAGNVKAAVASTK